MTTDKMNWASTSRNHVKNNAEKRKNIKVGLYFPSGSCDDLERALSKGIIDKETFLIIVEGDKNLIVRKENLRSIQEFLNVNKLTNVHIHPSRVHTLNLTKVLDGRKIELLFFDICGNYTSEIFNWFNKYQECFAYNMRLPMTIAIHPRGRKKSKKCELFMAIEKVTDASLRDLGLHNIPNSILESDDIDCLNLLSDIRLTLKAIHYTFSRRVINIKSITPYRFSKTNMVNFETMVCGLKEEDTTFKTIAQKYSSNVCDAKKIIKPKKTKKQIKSGIIIADNANDIIKALSLKTKPMTAGKKAWISKLSNKAGKDPVRMQTKIEKILSKVA